MMYDRRSDRHRPAGFGRSAHGEFQDDLGRLAHRRAAGHVYRAHRPEVARPGPRMERRKTPAGREYDAWMLDGQQVGTLGAVMQAGQRFEDPSQIDFLGVWEDVRKGAYDPHAMIVENEQDGIWGSVSAAEPGPVLVPHSGQPAAVRDLPRLQRLDRRFLQALSRPAEGHRDAQRRRSRRGRRRSSSASPRWGWSASFIPVAPLAGQAVQHPIYDRFWWTAQELKHAAAAAHRHAARRHPGQRVHDERRPS